MCILLLISTDSIHVQVRFKGTGGLGILPLKIPVFPNCAQNECFRWRVSAILGKSEALLQECLCPSVGSLSHEQPPLGQRQFSPSGRRHLSSQPHRAFYPLQPPLSLLASTP